MTKLQRVTRLEKVHRENRNFIAAEMAAVNSTEPPVLAVAFRNPDFHPGTKWLNITQEQFKDIERILTLGKSEGKADS